MTALSIPSSSLLPRTLTLALTLNSHSTPPRLLFPSKPHRRPPKTLSPPISRSPLLSAPLSSLSNGASISLPSFEDLVEKDWSFLDSDPTDPELSQKAHRIISVAEIGDKSRVVACLATVGFVDQLVETHPCELLLVTHDSLFALAEIKEKHDKVRCWQGGIDAVPERLWPLDAVFLCYFPGMGVSIDQLLGSLAGMCSPGATVVISYDKGREVVERVHRQKFPDTVTSGLPDKTSLEKAAADHSFRLIEFVDEPAFYLAVLKFQELETVPQ